jgi:hypothetical protein
MTFSILYAVLLAAPVTANTLQDTGKIPAFFLAGDSTTKGDGGWGSGFLPTLLSPAWGINFAVQGTTTKSFVDNGYWANVTSYTAQYATANDVYVTISVGALRFTLYYITHQEQNQTMYSSAITTKRQEVESTILNTKQI